VKEPGKLKLVELAHLSAKQLDQAQTSAALSDTAGCIAGVQISSAMTPQRPGSLKRLKHPWTALAWGIQQKVPKGASPPRSLRRHRCDKRKANSHMGTHGWTKRSSSGSTEGLSACGRGKRRLPLGHGRNAWTAGASLSCLNASPIGTHDLPCRGFSAATKIKQAEIKLIARIRTWYKSIRYLISTSSYVWNYISITS
jgi:hypothetical protein